MRVPKENIAERMARFRAAEQRKCKIRVCTRTTPYLCRDCGEPVCCHHGQFDDETNLVRTCGGCQRRKQCR